MCRKTCLHYKFACFLKSLRIFSVKASHGGRIAIHLYEMHLYHGTFKNTGTSYPATVYISSMLGNIEHKQLHIDEVNIKLDEPAQSTYFIDEIYLRNQGILTLAANVSI